MAKRRRKGTKHFVCKWCDQDKQRPVAGRNRISARTIQICPVCRGPA